MRWFAAFLTFSIFCFADQQALADKRVALVIGNSAYQRVLPLTNPVNDAAAVAAMLKKADFNVVESRRDLKNAELRRAINDFFDRTRDADIAVVYYAGHGIEVEGSNYLIPVDAALERDRDVYDEAISLERVLQSIEPARKLRLVILDACRDNPFIRTMKRTLASRAISRGLVGIEPSKPNTLIAFAAKAGSTADDGNKEHSPFTLSLLNHLTTPGLDLRKAFGLVRDEVMNATGNKQEPFVYGSLGGNDVTLVPAPIAPAVVAPPARDAAAELRRDYEFAERIGTKEAWDYFLDAHRKGFYADLAKAQRNKLAAETARVAATEKARLTGEHQAKLAAEGARASEQARAAAQAKAAEEVRLAAEKKQRLEDAKLAAAEQAKIIAQAKSAEDARLAAEKIAKLEQARVAASESAKVAAEAKAAEGAKKSEEIKIASTEQAAAKEDKPKADKAADQAIVSLTPSDETNPVVPKSDRPASGEIPRLLQSELRRVGCKIGKVDGAWNASSRAALTLFNENAGTKLDVKVASIDALDAVRSRAARVCPLDCERGYRADGDRCIKIICDNGFALGSNGTCQKRLERAPRVAARRERGALAPVTPVSRGKCFAFNGKQYCE
jgi:uncharacterized caspase-like protein